MDLSAQTTTRQMAGSWENFSIIAAKYMWPCKDRVEAPDKRFAYWLKEKENCPTCHRGNATGGQSSNGGGNVIDHVVPLACGGAEAPSDIQ
jgi:hypothetical protein